MKNLKKFLPIVLIAALTNPLQADFTSLTEAEIEMVKRAFEQSHYYKYYAALAQGEDTIEIKEIRKVSEKIEGGITKRVYEIRCNLVVDDIKFQRIMSLDIEYQEYQSPINIWTGVVGLGAAIIGLIVGIFIR